MPLNKLSTPAAGLFPEFQHLELLAGQVWLRRSGKLPLFAFLFVFTLHCRPYTPIDSWCCVASHVNNVCAPMIILLFSTLTFSMLVNESALAQLRFGLSVEMQL